MSRLKKDRAACCTSVEVEAVTQNEEAAEDIDDNDDDCFSCEEGEDRDDAQSGGGGTQGLTPGDVSPCPPAGQRHCEQAWAEVVEGLGPSPCGQFWLDARTSNGFPVRGASYLYDRVKVPAGAAVCPLLWFDIFTVPDSYGSRVDHISTKGACAQRIKELTAGPDAPFLFVTAIQVPGTPVLYMVMYWACNPAMLSPDDIGNTAAPLDDSTSAASETAPDPSMKGFMSLLQQYANIPITGDSSSDTSLSPVSAMRSRSLGMDRSQFAAGETAQPADSPCKRSRSVEVSPPPASDVSGGIRHSYAFHNSRFKLIPQIVDGPWVVRRAVGAVPCLLGTKVTTRYFRGEHYVETNVEVGSSVVAQRIIGCCRGYSGRIDVQLGVVLQGEEADTLPEKLLGTVQFRWLQVDDPRGVVPLFD